MDVKAQHQNGSINVNNNSSSASLSSADSNSSSNIASSVGSNSSSSALSSNSNNGSVQNEAGCENGSLKQQQQQQQQQVNKCNLIVNYLPQSVKEADFNQLFAKIGPLKSCRLMFDRQTGYSFGYGFVEYTNEEDAKKAIDSLNGYQIEHKRLKVSLARPNCDETKNTNLYVRNIPMSYDEQQLQDLFGQCGEVIQARILRDQNTSFSRRIGFVIMATKQMAQQAIQKLDNTMPPEVGGGSSSEPIYVKYADEDGKNKRGGMSGGHHHHQHHHHNHHGGGGHHHNHHHNNQNHNQYQHRGNNGANSFNQFQNSFQNASFMMNTQQQQQQQHQQQNNMALANLSNSLANLGKMKNPRSNGHQNHRYNPILNANGGAANTNLIGLGGNGAGGAGGTGAAGPGLNNVSNNSANFSNPWNLNMSNLNQAQPPFSAFNTSGVASGFDSLINNTLAGMNTNYMHHAHHQNTNFLESSLGVVIDGNNVKSLYNSGTGSNNNNAPSTSPTSTIYVYGIGQQASEADLYSLFANYGRISRVNVIKNSKTGLCKGFGFVVFESPEEANYAVHSMNGFMYNNRPLQVQLHNE